MRQIEMIGTRLADEYRVSYDIKDGSIVNADVSATAAIAQSKLNMNAASTRANATGIAQTDLGLASFDDGDFSITNGWVTLKTGNIDLSDIVPIANMTALTNISGASASAAANPITQYLKQQVQVLLQQSLVLVLILMLVEQTHRVHYNKTQHITMKDV